MANDTNFEADAASLAPKLDFTRRSMMVTTLATGFAASVQPVAAQTTITTDTSGLEAGEVKIKTADGEIPAYRAMPATGSNLPTILVVQEIFGVHEHIKDLCRRFAKLGYFAIAPELYARQGDVSQLKTIDEIRPIVAKVPDRQVMSDLDAAVDFARASGRAQVDKLAITGFCWGGRVVWLYAAHNPGLKAGVAWYGRLVGDPNAMTPKHPVDLAADLKAPVLGLYGGADGGIPVDTVEKMKAACAAAKKSCEFQVYPDTPHAFNADYRPSYREGPAKDGWARMLAFLKAQGVA
jgi:carboxymethylenebutenolidase